MTTPLPVHNDQEGTGKLHLETAPPDRHTPRRVTGHDCRHLNRMFAPVSDLRKLRAFVVAVYGRFDPELSLRRAAGRWAKLVNTTEFLADAHLTRALAMLSPETFEKMIAYVHSPVGQRVRTNNSCRMHQPPLALLGKAPLQVVAASDDRTVRDAGSGQLAAEENQERSDAASFHAHTIETQSISQPSENIWINLSRPTGSVDFFLTFITFTSFGCPPFWRACMAPYQHDASRITKKCVTLVLIPIASTPDNKPLAPNRSARAITALSR